MRIFHLIGAGLALGGCASPGADRSDQQAPAAVAAPIESTVVAEPPASAKQARASDGEVERLMRFFERIRRLPAGELSKAHESVRWEYARSASDVNRISYAMLLAMPGAPFGDDARALALLEPVVKNGEAGTRGVALLLTTFIQERRRVSNELNAAQQKLEALRLLERKLSGQDQNNLGKK